jgi:D-glycero-D-manno-heptose 1,7-bisphosphate phosphatase
MVDQLGESFILLSGDLIFDIDFTRLIDFHTQKKSLATLVSHPNSHPYDSTVLVSDNESRITGWINKEDPRDHYKNRVSSGIYLLTTALLLLRQKEPDKNKVDLDRDVLKPLVGSGRLFAYDTPEYIKDMGTPDRYHQVEDDLKSGLVSSRNLSRKQKAIFLDRDGTINVYKNFVANAEDFSLINGAGDAIRMINNSGFLAIVITNQPVIARGECSVEDLENIHWKMETDLGKDGAYIDDLFYCPHHPDRGFPGERPEYKIDCDCRKPKPGLILRAAAKYNIDLSASWMAGDDMRDVLAGKAAGCKTALISSVSEQKGDTPMPAIPDMICASLREFTERLFT